MEIEKDDVSLNVVNAFLNVLFNKENLQTAKTQVEFSRNQIIQVNALVEAGVKTEFITIPGGLHGKFDKDQNAMLNTAIFKFIESLDAFKK